MHIHRDDMCMKAAPGNCFAAFLCIVLLVISGCALAPRSAINQVAPLEAGMAEIDITPPIGYRMAGDFPERLSTGMHDPLKAKALVLRQGREQVALVFCDLVGMSLNVTTNARVLASRATGIPVPNIVIAATHSHTGPLFDDVRSDYFHQAALAKFGNDPQQTISYPPFLIECLVKVIAEAKAKLAPGELVAGKTMEKGYPFNRRYYMKNGKVAFNPGMMNPNIVGPAGPVDSEIGILLVKNRKQSQPIGGLTVFAMHCDTAGVTEFSADYPYFIQETLRKAFGRDYISAFGAGTCGNLNHLDVSKPAQGPVKGFDVSEHIGSSIGETVLTALPHLNAIAKPSLAIAGKTLRLPLQEVTPQELAEAKENISRLNDTNLNFYVKVRAVKALDLVSRGSTWPMEVQVFRLDGDTAIVCLPAEIFVEFGLAIKKASPFKQTLVISICNDRPCYVPTIKAFSEGSYEVINSRLKPGAGEAMVQTAIKLLNQLKE